MSTVLKAIANRMNTYLLFVIDTRLQSKCLQYFRFSNFSISHFFDLTISNFPVFTVKLKMPPGNVQNDRQHNNLKPENHSKTEYLFTAIVNLSFMSAALTKGLPYQEYIEQLLQYNQLVLKLITCGQLRVIYIYQRLFSLGKTDF